MSNIKKLNELLDNFTEEDAPAIYYAWQAVKHAPGHEGYREHLLQLLDRFHFEKEYEMVLREGIKTCPDWENGPALLARWLAERGQYSEASYTAGIAGASLDAATAGASVIDTVMRLKNGDVNPRQITKAHTRATRRAFRKISSSQAPR